MISASLKSHFCLIAIRHWSGTPALMLDRKNAALQHLSSSELRALDPVQRNLGQWNVALGEIPHQIVDAGRNRRGFERGAIPKAGGEGGGNRFHIRSID